MAAAKQILEKACDTGYGPGCFNTGLMYRQGIATPQNETLARAHFRHGCELGFRTACQALELSPSQARR
jgi:TPR repeat protein